MILLDTLEHCDEQKMNWMFMNPEMYKSVFTEQWTNPAFVQQISQPTEPTPSLPWGVQEDARMRFHRLVEQSKQGWIPDQTPDPAMVEAEQRFRGMRARKEEEQERERAKVDPRIKFIEEYDERKPGEPPVIVRYRPKQ